MATICYCITLPIKDIVLTPYKPPVKNLPMLDYGLNGDLNQNAGGKDIYLKFYRKFEQP